MMKKAKEAVGLCLFGCLVMTADVAQAGLSWPGDPNQKWELSLDGFAKLYLDDVANPTKLLLRSLTKCDSVFKGQGTFTTPAPFYIGLDPNPGGVHDPVAPDVTYTGVIATLITGMKVIGLDIIGEDAHGNTIYNLISGDANVLNYLNATALADGDIVYFGAQDTNTTPHALMYWDPLLGIDDLSAADGWNANGDTFTDPANSAFSIGANDVQTNSTLMLDMTFQNLAGLEVDSTKRAAMTGTLVANVMSNGDVRPFVMTDVVGGDAASLVVPGGMTFSLGTDVNNDGRVSLAERTNNRTQLVGDMALSLGSRLAEEGFVTLSDPLEFVSTPEPASLAVWGALGLLGLYSARRRRRA